MPACTWAHRLEVEQVPQAIALAARIGSRACHALAEAQLLGGERSGKALRPLHDVTRTAADTQHVP